MDLPATDDEVLLAFRRWVSVRPAAPRHVTSLIEHVEISHGYAGLLDTEIHSRRLDWASVPVPSRTRLTRPAVADVDIDVWTVEPHSLRERTLHIAVCHHCAGGKKVRCDACGGSGKSVCGACNGQRKAYGRASNGAYRLLNCTVCRGKGETDCRHCRRGTAVCSHCAGEGRLQRWRQIEPWQRATHGIHPQTVGADFAWQESPTNETVARDAELVIDIDQPHPLTPDDLAGHCGDHLAGTYAEWLSVLHVDITAEERIVRQRLRVARIPARRVHYRVGNDHDHVTFTGCRLLPAATADDDAFARRAVRLRALRVVLALLGIAVIVASLARGAFFRSFSTFLSLLACCAGLVYIHVAAADWTGARLRTRPWVILSVASLSAAIGFAVAALPRLGHARQLIADGRFGDAEDELRALPGGVPPSAWADLRLERVRHSTDIESARRTMAEIPSASPQHQMAGDAVDRLILATARDEARKSRWSDASASLAELSDRARGRPEAVTLAESVCVAAARASIGRGQWPAAALAIATARRVGVTDAALEPLQGAIHTTAVETAEAARRRDDVHERFRLRLLAEAAFVAWEISTGNSGTAPLMALRTAMARDLTVIERSEKGNT